MLISDRKLRIYGTAVFAVIYFVFFILQEIGRHQSDFWLFLVRGVAATILFVALLWEPVRFVVLQSHKRWYRPEQTIKRKVIVALILIPYAFILGVGGQLIENGLIWQTKITNIPFQFFMGVIGLNTLFILAEVALYESLFFVEKWHNSALEAKELKKINLQLQYDSLKVQIQPHFLFNTLNTLIGLIETDQGRAVKFTEELAFVYRYLLAASERPLIELEEEIRFTRAYYFLLKNRYDEGLHLATELKGNTAGCQVPPLCLQILLENAVKHNVITQARPLHVRIVIDPENRTISITNNLQRKENSSGSGRGLAHLIKKFDLVSLKGMHILEQDGKFQVDLPMVKMKEYESADY
jgi:hypothetical protein